MFLFDYLEKHSFTYVWSWSLTLGRCINFSFFENEGFSIENKIKESRVRIHLFIKSAHLSSLVWEFYGEVNIENGCLISTVKGKIITIMSKELGQILWMRYIGTKSNNLSDCRDALKCVLEKDDVEGISEIYGSQLYVEMKLLHSMACRLSFPPQYWKIWFCDRKRSNPRASHRWRKTFRPTRNDYETNSGIS